jgi:hypothetical protein
MISSPSRIVLGSSAVAVMVSLLSHGIGHAQPPSRVPAPADADSRASTRKLVEAALAAQDAKDYSTAIDLNLKAFAIDPHPLLLFNLGQAHRLAGCSARAISFYERYLALEPKGSESEAARAHLAELKRSGGADDARCAKALAARASTSNLQVDAPRPMGRFQLHSDPSGLVVMLDGLKIGVTPLDQEVAVGSHTVALVDRGMLVGERRIEVKEGERVELTIPVNYPDRGPRRSGRLAPVLLWIGGGLALTSSGVAFYLGQQGGAAHPEDPYVYEGATPTGFVLAGAGAAAIGVGVWLWVRGSRESAPVALLGAGTGYLGWQGRF